MSVAPLYRSRRRSLTREGVQESFDLGDVGTAHEDSYSPRCQGLKGVFVGYIVTQVHGHDAVAIEAKRPEQIKDGLPFVPVDVGLDLVDHLAWRHLEFVGVFGEDLIDDPSHRWLLVRRDQPIVGGDGRLLRLDQDPLDSADLLAQALLYLKQQAC